jgi:hypothetical protein
LGNDLPSRLKIGSGLMARAGEPISTGWAHDRVAGLGICISTICAVQPFATWSEREFRGTLPWEFLATVRKACTAGTTS